MKAIISILLLFPLLTFMDASKDLPQKYSKKIHRTVKKVFSEKGIVFDVIEIEDSLRLTADFQIFELKKQSKTIGYITLNRTNACRVGGCSRPTTNAKSTAYEKFYYLCIFDSSLGILKVKVLEYESEYGYEITARGWLKQFEKANLKQFKYGENIDALSGATVSAQSIINDINQQVSLVNLMKQSKFI